MNRLFKNLFALQILLLALLTLPALAEIPFKLPSKAEIAKLRSAVIKTSQGNLVVKLFPDKAPWHVANFKYLSDNKFYDGLKFHIFQPDYLIQAGTPNENLAGGPNYTLPPEFNDLKHLPGSLSMVRKPDYLDFEHSRNSHGSQFRIMLSKSEHMDGQYVVFGKIIKGKNVLSKLRKNDRIISITVFTAE